MWLTVMKKKNSHENQTFLAAQNRRYQCRFTIVHILEIVESLKVYLFDEFEKNRRNTFPSMSKKHKNTHIWSIWTISIE